jgi:hypothetical protein
MPVMVVAWWLRRSARFVDVVAGAGCFVESYRFGCHCAIGKRLWDSRIGHLGESQLDGLLATQVEGMAFSASGKLVFCETCVVCKSHVRRILREPADQNVGVFKVLGLDFCGPMSVPSLGRRYTLCAGDFPSRFMLHDAVRSKKGAPASFRRMLTTIRSLRDTVRHLRMGNDTVFLGSAFRNLLDE